MITSHDYAQQYLKGVTFYGDFDFTHNIGSEFDIHYSAVTPQDISENSYLVDPRYTLRHKRLAEYRNVLFRFGRFGFQKGDFVSATTATYGVYAFGAGVEFMATHHINVRPFDVEFQKWPGFTPHSLSPITYTFVAAYVV